MTPSSAATSWQERALARSLADQRSRSVARLASFVAAARELAAETGSSAFTVQQVVERSGQSLKSFYRHFAGKDDLLLALVEEDIAVGALFLTELVDHHQRPERRVQAWVEGVFDLLAAGEQGYVAVLVREHRRLSEAHPDQMDAALAPFLDLLARDLAAAAATGTIRPGDPARDARTVFDLVLTQIHQLVLTSPMPTGAHPAAAGRAPRGGRPAAVVAPVVDADHAARVAERAAYTWAFCWGGLAAPASDGRRSGVTAGRGRPRASAGSRSNATPPATQRSSASRSTSPKPTSSSAISTGATRAATGGSRSRASGARSPGTGSGDTPGSGRR